MFDNITPGPAAHEISHNLVEKRTDIGIKKFEVENASTASESVDDKMPLNPNYDQVRPNHLGITFKFFEEERFKDKFDRDGGKWKYYDVDLDAIRETLAKDMYIGGSKFLDDPEKFAQHKDLIEAITMLREYQNNRKPDPGKYDPEKPKPHLPDIDFDKMQSRAQYYDISDDEDDKEGDVLILDPR